jgi:hypothetical protein
MCCLWNHAQLLHATQQFLQVASVITRISMDTVEHLQIVSVLVLTLRNTVDLTGWIWQKIKRSRKRLTAEMYLFTTIV